MLYKVIHYNKYGTLIERIIHLDTPLNQRVKTGKLHITPFKYSHVHPIYSPHFHVNLNGEKFILPSWQKVHPKTTLEDIEWNKPVIQSTKPTHQTWTFKSSTGDNTYTVSLFSNGHLKCSCMGFWRGRGKCKHTSEVEKSLAL
jgi:hypothetical protein